MRTVDAAAMTRFLDGLLEGHAVYAPVLRGGSVVFGRIASGSETLLDFTNSKVPPKHVVMPQQQILLSSAGDGGEMVEHVASPGPSVLFGVRPCDARALALLDRIFCGGRDRDTYYQARRQDLTVVALGCGDPRETCFCGTTGGGPLSYEGADILLEPCGEGWRVHVVSERGGALASAHGLPAESGGLDARPDALSPAIEPEIDLSVLKETLDRSFDDPRWRTLAETCLGCGVCSFLCPTCHCFDIVDGYEGGIRSRSRVWDSCQFPSFTAQASGFNPRPSGVERLRQRLMHKFSYCIENYGSPGCVGCGRCITECPVSLDIRRLLAAFVD